MTLRRSSRPWPMACSNLVLSGLEENRIDFSRFRRWRGDESRRIPYLSRSIGSEDLYSGFRASDCCRNGFSTFWPRITYFIALNLVRTSRSLHRSRDLLLDHAEQRGKYRICLMID